MKLNVRMVINKELNIETINRRHAKPGELIIDHNGEFNLVIHTVTEYPECYNKGAGYAYIIDAWGFVRILNFYEYKIIKGLDFIRQSFNDIFVTDKDTPFEPYRSLMCRNKDINVVPIYELLKENNYL